MRQRSTFSRLIPVMLLGVHVGSFRLYIYIYIYMAVDLLTLGAV